MDKRSLIEEFLDYGGNELFSTLMHSNIQRAEAIDRLVHLLQKYSDSCRRIKGRSAAYRFMLRKALRNGWLGRGSKDLKSHRLTTEDREYVIKKLDGYILSVRRNSRVIKKLLIVVTIMIIAGIFAFATIREFQGLLSYLPL